MRSGSPAATRTPKLGRPYVSIGFPSGPRICTPLTRSCGFALATPGTAATRSTSVERKVAGRSVPASIGVTGVTVMSAVLVVKFFFRACGEGVGEDHRTAGERDAEQDRDRAQHEAEPVREDRAQAELEHQPATARVELLHRVEHGFGGRVEQLGLEPAVGQEQHAVGVRGRGRVVGDHDDGLTEVTDGPMQEAEYVGRRARVEVAGRLVGEHHVRPGDERAGAGHPLLLAAGQLGRFVPEAVGQADGVDHGGRASPGPACGRPGRRGA